MHPTLCGSRYTCMHIEDIFMACVPDYTIRRTNVCIGLENGDMVRIEKYEFAFFASSNDEKWDIYYNCHAVICARHRKVQTGKEKPLPPLLLLLCVCFFFFCFSLPVFSICIRSLSFSAISSARLWLFRHKNVRAKSYKIRDVLRCHRTNWMAHSAKRMERKGERERESEKKIGKVRRRNSDGQQQWQHKRDTHTHSQSSLNESCRHRNIFYEFLRIGYTAV